MKKILLHGSGHRAASWDQTISYMTDTEDILCPDLSLLLEGKEATYEHLYASFAAYCNRIDGPVHLCGLSLGGVLAADYALEFPQKVKTLVLIGTPYKVPKAALAVQSIVFRLLPKSLFDPMAFDKKNTLRLGASMKNIDFSSKAGRIQCPALILCGEKDRANMSSARAFTQHIKHAELNVIENTGHVVNEENPRMLAAILNDYYASYGDLPR